MTIRVHLADDHTMFRQGMEAILTSRGGVEVVGSTSTGEDAASMVGRTRPDVIVTEIDMQPKGAQEVIEGLRGASPGSRIVVLTMIETPRHLKALSRLGIDAYLHKTFSAEDLLATIDATVSQAPDDGDAVVSTPHALLQRLTEGPVGDLSEREAEVVVLAARGLSNRRIARELHISEGTVKRHMANIYEKAGVHSRTEAVRKALMEQWIGIHEITSSANGSGSGNGLR